MPSREKTECTQCGQKRGIVSLREVCRDCHDRDRRLDDALMDLLQAADRWLSETGPGMHVNTATGRGRTRRAVERLKEIIDAV